jgi:hypothetical protein
MTASNITPLSAADRFGTRLLLVNGVLLAAIALVAFLTDLAGAFLNIGGFASVLYQNDAAVGMVEAHGLAFIAAVLLVVNRNALGPRFNFAAAAVHLLLGSSNLLFWPLYGAHGLLVMGVVTTAMHGLFFALELGAALWRKPEIVTGPGAVFRVAAGITIFTGVALHISRLPLGPESFQQNVLTPVADMLFAVPMTIAGIAGALLWRRAQLPQLWEKIVYGFVVVFFLGSIFIHAKTAITWDTSYVNAFPAWYPILALVYLTLIGLFAVTRTFSPARTT